MSDRGEYDTPEEEDDDDEEEEEEGECSGTSDEEGEEDDEENCDPSGLFDALAAAHEAEERYRQKEKAAVSEEDRISEDAITVAFKEAISGGWLSEDEEEDQTVNKGDIEEGALTVGEELNWKEGDRCLAVFSEDGETYNAKIVLLKHWKGAAVVHFFEYGNQEEVKLENLRPYKRTKVTIAMIFSLSLLTMLCYRRGKALDFKSTASRARRRKRGTRMEIHQCGARMPAVIRGCFSQPSQHWLCWKLML